MTQGRWRTRTVRVHPWAGACGRDSAASSLRPRCVPAAFRSACKQAKPSRALPATLPRDWGDS
eukprot:11194116-Lingulodinium_polyedra.AAC.1